MAKVVQTQILDEDVIGIDQSENDITAKTGDVTTGKENDKITIKNTIGDIGEIMTGAGNDNVSITFNDNAGWTEEYKTINLGKGDDTLSLDIGDYFMQNYIDVGDGDDKVTLVEGYFNGWWEEGTGLELGTGDDTLIAKGSELSVHLDVSTIRGDDVLEQGKGHVYLDFSNLSTESVNFLVSGKDLVIKIIGDGEFGTPTLTIKNHLALGSKSVFKGFIPAEGMDFDVEIDEYSEYISSQYILSKIDGYKLLNNKITGTDHHDKIVTGIGDDLINAGKGDDIIKSGFGNDTISGGSGINTIVISDDNTDYAGQSPYNYGTDVINSGNGYDILRFDCIDSIEDINFGIQNNDLLINYGENGVIVLKNYLKLQGKHSVKEMVFADGSSVNLAEEIGFLPSGKEKEAYSDKKIEEMYIYDDDMDIEKHDKHIYGGEYSESLTGSRGNDFISTGSGSNLVNANAGHDSIYIGYNECYEGEYGEDEWIEYPEYNYPENTNGDDTIYAGAGNDVINDMDGSKIGNHEIYGEAGDDEIWLSTGGGHKIYGGAGNDTISVSGSNEAGEMPTVDAGKGVNEIFCYEGAVIVSGGGTDSLIYWPENGEYNFEKVGDDLVLNEIITLKDYYKLNGKHSVKYIDNIDINNFDIPINDTIQGSAWIKNNLKGTVYADSIVGGYSNDVIKGNNGHDIIRGEAGNDKLYGDAGNDIIWGEGGNDTIYGGTGFNEIRTGSDSDIVYCDKNGSTTVYAGAGENKIYSSAGANTFVIENEKSLTTIYNATANDTLDLSALNWDNLYYELDEKTKDLYISFDNTAIVLKNYFKAKDANFLNNIINSDGEMITIDSIYKNSEMNYVEFGNYVKVNVTGTMLSDSIVTGDMADTIKGGYGDDTITSGAGNDKLYGDYGDDEISVGTDSYYLKNDKYVDGGNGDDSIEVMGYGKHKIYGGSGDDNISINIGKATIYGGDGDDEIFAGETSEDCKIYGDKGNDYITTGSGNDYIDAGNGDDVIIATAEGNGKDTLYGGKGADTYYLSASDFSGSLIYDASGYSDKIVIENASIDEAGGTIIYFDLKIDNKGNIVESASKNLYISDSNFMQYHKEGDSYHKIKDFFVK